jgi:hypothetical protein
MTEAEWLACTDPQKMLEFLRGKASDRKLRLFAVSCCRRIWHLFTEMPSRRAVEEAERYADGAASREELEAAGRPLRYQPGIALHRQAPKNTSAAALWAGWTPLITWTDLHDAVGRSAGYAARAKGSGKGQRGAQAALLRDLVGPLPFRPVAVNPAWLTWNDGTVARLAKGIYEGHRFADLPILADALEEAGCTDADILAHLRGPGPHVLGCWVLDAILGNA